MEIWPSSSNPPYVMATHQNDKHNQIVANDFNVHFEYLVHISYHVL